MSWTANWENFQDLLDLPDWGDEQEALIIWAREEVHAQSWPSRWKLAALAELDAAADLRFFGDTMTLLINTLSPAASTADMDRLATYMQSNRTLYPGDPGPSVFGSTLGRPRTPERELPVPPSASCGAVRKLAPKPSGKG